MWPSKSQTSPSVPVDVSANGAESVRDNGAAPLKVCLVSIPTATDFEDPVQFESEGVRETAADIPLGVLALAAVLEEIGIVPQIVDSNAWYIEYLHSGARLNRSSFSQYAAGRLASLDADLFGFSTICNSYPITIQTAGHLKELRPSAVTLFGGPQASVVDLSTLRHFPFVDFILRGEADRSLPELATRLAGGLAPETVPGITALQDLAARPAATRMRPCRSNWTSFRYPLFTSIPWCRPPAPSRWNWEEAARSAALSAPPTTSSAGASA